MNILEEWEKYALFQLASGPAYAFKHEISLVSTIAHIPNSKKSKKEIKIYI